MRWLIPLTTSALAAACAPDFVPYNQLERLRVLAIQSDPVWVSFGETASLTPLVYVPPGDSLTYQWSWCPFTSGANTGYDCAFTEAELQQAIDANLPAGTSFDVPSFDLGTEPLASFTNTFPPELLTGACVGLVGQGGAPAGVLPDCSRSFPISVRLDVSTSSETLTAVRDLALIIDLSIGANENPAIAALRVGKDDVDFDAAEHVAADGSTPLARETDATLYAELSEADAESFLDAEGEAAQERLVLTWFVEAGETEVTRTALAAGKVGLAEARRNVWTTPGRPDLARDQARLLVVVRDDRGGVGWIDRTVTLVAP